MTEYENAYESITQAEVDALTPDDLLKIAIEADDNGVIRDVLLKIATDGGARQLVRCTECGDGGEGGVKSGSGHIVAYPKESLKPVDG